MSPTTPGPTPTPDFVHHAFLYAGDDEYLAGTTPFVDAGLVAGEPVLVAVPEQRRTLIEDRFGDVDPSMLRFLAMEDLGRNPARIAPAWNDFVAPHLAAGRRVRGIGEPIWHGRADDEIVECVRHEALLNIAFARAVGFTLMCPFDTGSLPPTVVDHAERHHPQLGSPGSLVASPAYVADVPALLDSPLTAPPDDVVTVEFDERALRSARVLVAQRAAEAGMTADRVDDLSLAVSEALTNSVRHGGGRGQLLIWRAGSQVVCEVRDRGRITDPLAGRVRPATTGATGRGLWLMNQLCDLVQHRRLGSGQVVRLKLAI